MDPKEAETYRKMQALAAYIEKQLAAGTPPKDLQTDLIARKVPEKLAEELIEKGLATQKTPASTPPAPEGAKTTRQERIREFINTQANTGNTVEQILDMLVEKDVSHQEAADLILEETGLAVYSPQAGSRVSATLPTGQVPAAMPPIENLKALALYLRRQIADGIPPKDLVEALVGKGMERNTAIDTVMDAKQKQERN